MVSVLRDSGMRVVIYLDDHEPPHVHVFGDGKATIAIPFDDGMPKVVRVTRMKASELRKAVRIVSEHRAALMQKWEEYHG